MNCPVCGSQSVAKIHPKTQVLYHFCESCGCVAKDPAFLPTISDQTKKYLEHHNDWSNTSYVEYLRDFFVKSVLPYKQVGQMLDYGCGHTPVLAQMAEREFHFEVRGYDKFFFNDERILSNQFDVITLTEVLEHMEHPHAFFDYAQSHLKEEGIVSIMTLFIPKESMFFDWWYIRDKTHVCFHNEVSLRRLAILHGFKVLDCDHKRMMVLQKASN